MRSELRQFSSLNYKKLKTIYFLLKKFMTRIHNTVDIVRVEKTVIINRYLNFTVQWLFLCTTMFPSTPPTCVYSATFSHQRENIFQHIII